MARDEVNAKIAKLEAELASALEYQSATADIFQVISSSSFDLQPVLDTIVETAARLCKAEASFIWKCQGDSLHVAAMHAIDADFAKFALESPPPLDRRTAAGRSVLDNRTVHIPDVAKDSEYSWRGNEASRIGKYRTALGVPLSRDGASFGALALMRNTATPFSKEEISLVATFASQSVIAIENTRLFEAEQERSSELHEALMYQTAVSDVLDVISRSPNELQPVFDTINAVAAKLCQADRAVIHLLQEDKFALVAAIGVPETRRQALAALDKILASGSVVGRAILGGHTVHVENDDSEDAPDFTPPTMLSVPLVRNEMASGAITLARNRAKPFTERQIRLVETFAGQAVIAIENARLFEAEQQRTRELGASLEYQTAISDVLNAIAHSATETQPVFDAIVTNAARLCEAETSAVTLFDGDQLHLAAVNNLSNEAFALQQASYPMQPSRSQIGGRAVLDREIVQVIDVLKDPDYSQELARAGNWRSLMGVPLMRQGQAIGAIAMAKSQPSPYSKQQVELITTFARQAVIAIENARLFEEVQARTKELARSLEELRALGEVGRTVSSTLDLAQVLQTILANAVRMATAGGGAIYVYNQESEDFHLAASLNISDELMVRVRAQPLGMSDPIVGDCARQRQAVQIEDLTQEDVRRSPLLDLLLRAGVRSIMAVPLLHQNKVVGALVVRRGHTGHFDTETVRLLETFAAQSAIAVNNARLFEEVARKSVELEIASKHKSQFVANMSHELRTPLAAMLGYTELLVDGLFGALPAKAITTLERIQSNGKHLLGLINAVLDISKIEAGQFSLDLGEYAVSNLVETVRVATESLASGKGIGLNTDVAPELPHGFGDEPRLTQVLLNLVGNAIKFTDQGEVRITARAENDAFVIDVRDTGAGIPPAEQARIFEEFHQVDSSDTRVKGGTGLGLAIARRIVEMHGGRIWVESQLGAGATFHVRLPVRTTAQGAAA